MELSKEESLCRQNFGKLWKSCFPHVKIRAQKACGGKCDPCAYLSHSRKTYHDAESRQYITLMHALHRTMYMGERLTYYSRRQEALLYPETVWSLIGHGMAQHHCQLPYLVGLKELDKLTIYKVFFVTENLCAFIERFTTSTMVPIWVFIRFCSHWSI